MPECSLTRARGAAGCPQRHRLLVAEARMNVRRTPPHGPVAVLASHLQLAVVRPHAVFRKVPLVGVADRRSVTVHLHRRGLGSHRLGLERIPGVTQYRTRGIRPVRQFCCLVDIPVTERTQELLRDGLGAGGFRSTRTDPPPPRKSRCRRPTVGPSDYERNAECSSSPIVGRQMLHPA